MSAHPGKIRSEIQIDNPWLQTTKVESNQPFIELRHELLGMLRISLQTSS